MKRTMVIISFFMIATGVYGNNPYAFLEYGTGVYSTGSREAVISGSGVEAVMYNPSLLAIRGSEILFSITKPFTKDFFSKDGVETLEGINVLSAGISKRYNDYGAGISILYMRNSDITIYDEYGNAKGTFGTTELCFTVGYGKKLTHDISAGISSKIVYQNFFDGYYRAVNGISFGILKEIHRRFGIGAVVENIISFPLITENMEFEEMRRGISIGISYRYGIFNVVTGLWSDFKEVNFSTSGTVNVAKWLTITGGFRDGLGYTTEGIKAFEPGYTLYNIGMGVSLKDWRVEYRMGYMRELGIQQSAGIKWRY